MKLSVFLKMVGGKIADIKVLTGKDALKVVEKNGDALRYVKDQSEAVCLKAVESDGYALQYVKDQSEAVCLKAVEKNGDALQYVNPSIFEPDGNAKTKQPCPRCGGCGEVEE